MNQTNRWARSVFQGSVQNPATFKKVAAGSQRNLDKSRFCHNVGKEHKVKNTCGEKMPTQNKSARGKKITEWLKTESATNHSAMGWAESTKWV